MFVFTPRKTLLLLGTVALTMLLCTQVAFASASAIYAACAAETSLSGFSKEDLEAAKGGVPADLDEYSSCTAKINAAILDKTLKNVPGGGSDVKGKRDRLRLADVEDLTTKSDRKKALAYAKKNSQVDSSDPLGTSADAAITAGGGKTLASSTAPGTPIALILGLAGLVLLFGVDLTSRLTAKSRADKSASGPSPRDTD